MRLLALVALALIAAASSAQTLPQFSDYPAGRAYRGRVAPLVEASSPNARTFRTMTRRAMAGGVNFAGHYVVAVWGCGTECADGQIVDARTGRAVADLPFNAVMAAYHPDSRLLAFNTPAELFEVFGTDPEDPIPTRYQSMYWTMERGGLHFLGALVASDLEQIRRGGPTPALRQATPGDVLVPLAVGNTWTYAGADGSTTTLRVVGPASLDYGVGMRVERTTRGAGPERRTVETWSGSTTIGDGRLDVRTADDAYRGFDYTFGVPQAEGEDRVERATVRVGAEALEAFCYVDTVGEYDAEGTRPSRACFVPRIGMVSDDRDGAMTLTSYTLR